MNEERVIVVDASHCMTLNQNKEISISAEIQLQNWIDGERGREKFIIVSGKPSIYPDGDGPYDWTNPFQELIGKEFNAIIDREKKTAIIF